MPEFASKFPDYKNLMEAADLPDIAIRTFAHYYRRLLEGETGLIAESEIEPARNLPHADRLTHEFLEKGRAVMDRTVLIKLNGGLGTSMGMRQAKTLLPVKDNLTFLDVIARHAIHMGAPLVLMNSFATRTDSLAALEKYPALKSSPIPLDFVQHRFPKVHAGTLDPAIHPEDPELSWNPPGHGDLYTAMATSGMLGQMLAAGFEYAFVSNGDNLGAALDPAILGYFSANEIPFMMEVAKRTRADRKGGHLAVRRNGAYILRESAQCPPEDQEAFQDIKRHRYFNTNNLWLHLPALKQQLEASDHILGLPLIRNQKTLNPRHPDSPKVYQLETAMGSAISVFKGAAALCVPRSRFAPVKTTDDLLAVRSDAYRLTDDYRVTAVHTEPPEVQLDAAFFKLIDQLEARFPYGPPSLVDCTRLIIQGDVAFGRPGKIIGEVTIHNPSKIQLVIPDGLVMQGD